MASVGRHPSYFKISSYNTAHTDEKTKHVPATALHQTTSLPRKQSPFLSSARRFGLEPAPDTTAGPGSYNVDKGVELLSTFAAIANSATSAFRSQGHPPSTLKVSFSPGPADYQSVAPSRSVPLRRTPVQNTRSPKLEVTANTPSPGQYDVRVSMLGEGKPSANAAFHSQSKRTIPLVSDSPGPACYAPPTRGGSAGSKTNLRPRPKTCLARAIREAEYAAYPGATISLYEESIRQGSVYNKNEIPESYVQPVSYNYYHLRAAKERQKRWQDPKMQDLHGLHREVDRIQVMQEKLRYLRFSKDRPTSSSPTRVSFNRRAESARI